MEQNQVSSLNISHSKNKFKYHSDVSNWKGNSFCHILFVLLVCQVRKWLKS